MPTNKLLAFCLVFPLLANPFTARLTPAFGQQALNSDSTCTSIKKMLFQNKGSQPMAYLDDKPFTGKACSYFPDGKIFTETNYVNGVKEGDYKIYFKNGRLETEGNIHHGKDQGIYRQYYDNGQLRYDYTYDNGLKTGIWRGYYRDGTPYTERHFEKNELNGKVLVWDEQGKLTKEYLYRNSKLIESK
jgi:antitoxin component YwqK of YwqJK toxin-antitoxin module